LLFGQFSSNVAEATTRIAAFDSNQGIRGAGFLAGLTPQQLSEILNFNFGAPPRTIFAVGTDAGAGPHVKVFNTDGSLRGSFFASGGFAGGVRVATGDVNGDGVDDIITGAGPGAPGGHVKVFDGRTAAEIASFFAYPGFNGGVYVAAGDVN